MVVAAAGGLGVYWTESPSRRGEARRLRAGETIRLDPGDGARGYLAVAGGFVAGRSSARRRPICGPGSAGSKAGHCGLVTACQREPPTGGRSARAWPPPTDRSG